MLAFVAAFGSRTGSGLGRHQQLLCLLCACVGMCASERLNPKTLATLAQEASVESRLIASLKQSVAAGSLTNLLPTLLSAYLVRGADSDFG